MCHANHQRSPAMSDKELLERFVKCAPKEWQVSLIDIGADGVYAEYHVDGHWRGLYLTNSSHDLACIGDMLAEMRRISRITQDRDNNDVGKQHDSFKPLVYWCKRYHLKTWRTLNADSVTRLFCNVREAYMAWGATRG